MQRIQNLLRKVSISRRVIAAFVLMALFVGGQATINAMVVDLNLNLLHNVADEDLRDQQDLFHISTTVRKVQEQLTVYLKDGTAQSTDAEDHPLTLITAALETAEALRARHEDNRRLNAITIYLQRYQNSVSTLTEQAEQGNLPEYAVDVTIAELSGVLDQLNETSDMLIEEVKTKLQASLEDAWNIAHLQRWGGFLLLVAIVGFAYLITTSIVPPLHAIQRDAEAIAGGDLLRRVTISGRDEITTLGRAFNEMAEQIGGLIGSLEERVNQRTRDLETIARIGSETTALRELDTLLDTAVDLIRERFGFYHVQIFLVDEVGENAVLRASTGATGKALLAQHHKLAVGSDSVIGQVTARGRYAIALDTEDAQVVHQPNPLLPDTRAEMALPLRAGDRVLGALDLQSTTPNAFHLDDVHVFQTLADQLANALENARLLEETQVRVHEIDLLNRQLTREAWSEFIGTTHDAVQGYRYDLHRVLPVTSESGTSDGNGFTVPIRSRGEVIGALQAAGPVEQFGEDEQSVIEAIAERVGLALESARLFQQTETALAETRALYQGSELLSAATNFDEILRSLVQATALVRSDRVTMGVFEHPWVEEDNPPEWVEGIAIWRQDGRPDPTVGQRYTVEQFPAIRLMSRDETLVVNDVGTDPRLDAATRSLFFDRYGMRSFVVIPFSIGNEWIGFVIAQFAEVTTFTEAELRRMRTLIGQQAALAVQSRLNFRQMQATLSETAVLYDASQALSAATNEQEIVDAFAGYALESGARAVALMYIETGATGEPEWAQLVARRMLGEEAASHVGMRIHLPDISFYRLVLSSPQHLVLISDLQTDDRIDEPTRQLLASMGNRAMVALPLRVRGHWVGLVTIGWAEPQAFTERDERIYRALRDQTAITIDGRRLLLQTQETARREQTLREIATHVRGSLDAETILRTAVRELGAALGRQTFIRLGSPEELALTGAPPDSGGDGASVLPQGDK